LSTWKPSSFVRTPDEEATWNALFQVREPALAELEKARQAKLIGKALEAKVTVALAPPLFGSCNENREALRELLNVSQLELSAAPADAPTTVTVAKAAGQKCERCWHWETDVGQNSRHPTICGRC